MPAPPSPSDLVVLTGAGISRESGLPTFRDPDGLWAHARIADVATPEAFARDPARVHTFYNARRRQLQAPGIAPNAAHVALARLEAAWPGRFLLVTQNVDDLHERAGSRAPVHLHGELLRARCTACGASFPHAGDLAPELPCPRCGRTGTGRDAAGLRPDVVWFGEVPFALERIQAALATCTLFAAVGTSGQVHPAAQFGAMAAAAGAHTVWLNLEPAPPGAGFAEHHHGPATAIVPAWVDHMLTTVHSSPSP